MRKINPQEYFYITFFDSLGIPYNPKYLPPIKYLNPIKEDLSDITMRIRNKKDISFEEKFLLVKNHPYHFSENKMVKRKQGKFLDDILSLMKEVECYKNKQSR